MKKTYILVMLIALMLIIIIGMVHAADTYTRLDVQTLNYNPTTGDLLIGYSNSNVPATNFNSWYAIHHYTKIRDTDKIYAFVFYSDKQLSLDIREIVGPFLFNLSDYTATCDDKTSISSKLGVDVGNMKCGTTTTKSNEVGGYIKVNNPKFKSLSTGRFYAFIMKYNVYSDQMGDYRSWIGPSFNSYANLETIDISKESATYIKDPKEMFWSDNYFATFSGDSVKSLINKPESSSNCGNGTYDAEEKCDGTIFWVGQGYPTLENATCNDLDKKYVSGNLKCNSDCTINIDDCEVTDESGGADVDTISIITAENAGPNYSCENHICYLSPDYADSTDSLRFDFTGNRDKANVLITTLEKNANIESIVLESLKTENTIPFTDESNNTGPVLGINLRRITSVPLDSYYFSIELGDYTKTYLVGVGYAGTNVYDYYVIVPAPDYNTYAQANLYKINNHKLIDFYGGSLPEWVPINDVVVPPKPDETKPDEIKLEDDTIVDGDCDDEVPEVPEIAMPFSSPGPGTYTSAQKVTISTQKPDEVIYYTLDGTDPDKADPIPNSYLYEEPITISSTTTLKAISTKLVNSEIFSSEIMTDVYVINTPGIVSTPVSKPVAGTYTSAQSVTLTSATSEADIYYTTNGSTPTTSSYVYLAPIPISKTTTIKAIATKSGMKSSSVSTSVYKINTTPVTPPPVIKQKVCKSYDFTLFKLNNPINCGSVTNSLGQTTSCKRSDTYIDVINKYMAQGQLENSLKSGASTKTVYNLYTTVSNTYGLNYQEKGILYANIMGESGFRSNQKGDCDSKGVCKSVGPIQVNKDVWVKNDMYSRDPKVIKYLNVYFKNKGYGEKYISTNAKYYSFANTISASDENAMILGVAIMLANKDTLISNNSKTFSTSTNTNLNVIFGVSYAHGIYYVGGTPTSTLQKYLGMRKVGYYLYYLNNKFA